MVQTLQQRNVFSAGDHEIVSIDYTDHLDSGEILIGTPTVTEQETSDLTISDIQINTAPLTILGRNVDVGAAVQFSVKNQLAGVKYRIRVEAATNATPARKFVRDVLIRCEA